MIRALIIEDEAPAAEDLRRLLQAHPEVRVAGEAGSIAGARKLLAQGEYDLVFLDVQLVGGTGFDLVSSVNPEAEIIFVTAYDQHALRAFEVNALGYLLKPVRRDRLAQGLRRIEKKSEETPEVARLKLEMDDLIHVKTGRSAARFVKLREIVMLTSEDNYSTLLLADGSRVLVRETLASWEERLPPTHFMRVHRQVILDLKRIEGFEHVDSRTTLLRVAGQPDGLAARREHWPEITARLERLGCPLRP